MSSQQVAWTGNRKAWRWTRETEVKPRGHTADCCSFPVPLADAEHGVGQTYLWEGAATPAAVGVLTAAGLLRTL